MGRYERSAFLVAIVVLLLPVTASAEEQEAPPPTEAETEGSESGAEAEEAAETPATEAPVPEAPVPVPEAVPVAVSQPIPVSAASEQITLMITSDLDGSLLDSPCGSTKRQPALPAVARLVNEAKSRGVDPLVIDAGDALFPSPLSNHLLSDEGRAVRVIETIRQAGYDVMSLGEDSLPVETDSLIGFLNAGRTGELPILLSNIACGEESSPETCVAGLAGLVTKQVVVERAGLKVGLFNIASEDFGASIRSRIRAGADLTDPQEEIQARVQSLREEGADLVVLISSIDVAETAPRLTLELLSELEDEHTPDLVITASTAQIVAQMVAPDGGPSLVTAPMGLLRQVTLSRDGERWVVEDSTTEPLSGEEPEIAETITSWNEEFCERYDDPLTGGQLAGELDRAAFGQLVLRAMREQTRAEVAFINEDAVVDVGVFPLTGQLTAAKVRRALPNRTELRVARVKGSDLTAIVGAVIDSERAYYAGFERDDDDNILVNGREIDPDQRYRVVTTAFVARGGDGINDSDAVEFRRLGVDVADDPLAERVVRWVDEERGLEPYDPEDELDLHRRVMWYGNFMLDAGMTYASIRSDPIPGRVDDEGNPIRYNQAQLSRQGVLDLRAAAEFNGGLSSRGHAWGNLVRLRYGMQRLETEVNSGEFDSWAESVDLVYFRSSYDLDYLRDVVLDGAWYGPSFFLEYQLESEFYHDDDTTPHFVEMTGLLGLKLKPLDWMQISAAFGIRSMITEPDPFPVPGLNLRIELTRRRLTDAYPVFLSAFVEYFVGWPVALPDTDLVPNEGSAVHKLSAELRLEVALYGPLNLVGAVRGFVYDEDPGSPATAFDATAGLSVSLGGHRQTF